MHKNLFKALLVSAVLALGLSSCDLFGPLAEVKVVNTVKYFNGPSIKSIFVYNENGGEVVSGFEPKTTSGIIEYDGLMGGCDNAEASVYIDNPGKYKLVANTEPHNFTDKEEQYEVWFEVKEIPSTVTIHFCSGTDNTYYLKVVD